MAHEWATVAAGPAAKTMVTSPRAAPLKTNSAEETKKEDDPSERSPPDQREAARAVCTSRIIDLVDVSYRSKPLPSSGLGLSIFMVFQFPQT